MNEATSTMPNRFADLAEGEHPSKVYFDFTPVGGSLQYAVEKDEGGRKRKFLEGVSSGTDEDGHGENMTEACIEGFQRQAQSANVKLFAGKHEVNFIDDVGLLVESRIVQGGDWYTKYRLYDEADDMGPNTLEVVNKIWKQVNGLPPYKKPEHYGFSIEGDIPEGGIQSIDTMGHRVMNAVDLVGVVLVRKPAYRTSIAYAVMKALDFKVRKDAADVDNFYDGWYSLNDVLDGMIRKALLEEAPKQLAALASAFDTYKEQGVKLCLKFPGVFREDPSPSVEALDPALVYRPPQASNLQALHKRLVVIRERTEALRARRGGGTDVQNQHDGPHGDPQ